MCTFKVVLTSGATILLLLWTAEERIARQPILQRQV